MLFKNKKEAIAYAKAHMEVKLATENGAYTCGRTITPSGMVNHSVGCAQPNPDVFFKSMNKSGAGWGVNFILGDFHKGEGRIIQTLRHDPTAKKCSRNWGVGSGKKGSWNNERIQWEICEPSGHTYSGGTMIGYNTEKNQVYFDRMWKLVVAFNVYICDAYCLDADTVGDHYESYLAGMGSGHVDVHHWWPKHGKSMDALRAEVKAILEGTEQEEVEMTKEDVAALIKKELDEREAKKLYATLEDVPGSYRPTIEKMMKKAKVLVGYNGGKDGDIKTVEDNTILVDETFCRIATVLDRMGLIVSE